MQLESQNPFGKINADQAIEETVTKDSENVAVTKGFVLKPAAITRYYLTSKHLNTTLL